MRSSALGRSQQAVAKLFEQTIPELGMGGVAIVLLDEVETLAVSRKRLSMDTNPVDVHRATDAALAGMDRLTREHRNVLLIATTNFAEALDEAVLSRADHIERIGLPSAAARLDIIADTSIGKEWPGAGRLSRDADRLARAAEGLDGRRIRKAIFGAMASDIETAKDPNKLTALQIEASFHHVLKDAEGPRKMRVRRDISSIPHRSASQTWQRIIDLITGSDSLDTGQLTAASGVMGSIITDEHPSARPIVIEGVGAQLRIYLRYGLKAVEEGDAVDPLNWNPTAGDWTMRVPCDSDNITWVKASLAKSAPRIKVVDVEEEERAEEGSNRSAATTAGAIGVDWNVRS